VKPSKTCAESNLLKKPLVDQLHPSDDSALGSYRKKVLGTEAGFAGLLWYELANLLSVNLGGGLGYWLRRKMWRPLFRACGRSPILGRGLAIRKPGHIRMGDHVSIDDHTMLDAGSGEETAIRIGNRVIISRGCLIQAKNRPLTIDDDCDIGAHTIVASGGGISLAPSVLVAANCYIGGARYHFHDRATPILFQGIYSRGPITIGEGAWIGATATILDGVTVGRGCVIGAGSVVVHDIPDHAVAAGTPARVLRFRDEAKRTPRLR
jgi:acetyltransferase-like isoleucine patch superfamily enzyme